MTESVASCAKILDEVRIIRGSSDIAKVADLYCDSRQLLLINVAPSIDVLQLDTSLDNSSCGSDSGSLQRDTASPMKSLIRFVLDRCCYL